MQTFSKNDNHRNFAELSEILGEGKNQPAAEPPAAPEPPREDPHKINTLEVMALLERLSPGISQVILETIKTDEDLRQRMLRGETDLIDVYQMLENTARPQIAPTARSANALGSGVFNAHALSDEEFERIRQLTHSGHNVRI